MPENNFESDLKALEDIVNKLESGELSLDESISLYEKGMEYSNKCRKALENAEIKIKKLSGADCD